MEKSITRKPFLLVELTPDQELLAQAAVELDFCIGACAKKLAEGVLGVAGLKGANGICTLFDCWSVHGEAEEIRIFGAVVKLVRVGWRKVSGLTNWCLCRARAGCILRISHLGRCIERLQLVGDPAGELYSLRKKYSKNIIFNPSPGILS